MGSFAAFFIDGGAWMFPIAIVSLVTLAIIIERVYYTYFVYSTNTVKFMGGVNGSIQRGDMTGAIAACKKMPQVMLSRVMLAGLESFPKGEDEVQRSLEEASIAVIPDIQRRGSVLAGLASIATLLGLLGTIMGLITAFMVVAEAPDDQKSVLLTKAISIAMNTTAFGLMVAIPALFAHLMVSTTSKRLIEEIEIYSVKLENLMFSNRK